MNAIELRARRNRVHLRLVAYRPSLEPLPEGHLRVVVQVVDRGRPVAEDPLCIGALSPLGLASYIHQSRMDGWEITPWERSH